MHPLGKMAIGVLLVIIGVYWLLFGPEATSISAKITPYLVSIGVRANGTWKDFLTLLNGGLPPLIALIGIFIVWLEWDEWRIERELAAEEKKAKRKRR